MPINQSTINAALRSWLMASTALPTERVIYENQGGPQPRTPFCTLRPRATLAAVGTDEERLNPNAPGVITRVGNRDLTASINFYGPGALTLAERALEWLSSEAGRTALVTAGLAVREADQVRDLTRRLETDYEERAQFDVRFGTVSTATEDVGYIESVEVEGELIAEDGTSIVVNITV